MKKIISYKKLLILVTLIAVANTHINAQNGAIKGFVVSKQDSVPIWGASIYISGTTYSSFSEEDGSFAMPDVTPGTYDISVEDFTTGDSALYKNVLVKNGETTNIKIGVGISVKLGEVVTISYEQPKSVSIEAAIEEVKDETKVTTIISSEEFKSKGDSKVTDAAKRASGVTVEGGKYLYVRGLSDRYSKTLLDGVEIPGLDPNRNAVQLDMFPTSFVQSLKVIKTFSPDLPGDFTGGLVDIRTKDYPKEFELKVSTGTTYNTQASFNKNFLTSQKSSTDWLGYDDGKRALPQVIGNFIQQDNFPIPTPSDGQDMEQVTDALSNEMIPTKTKSILPYSFGLTIGNTFTIGRKGDSLGLKAKRKIGVLGGINYKNSISYYNDGVANRYDLTGDLTIKKQLDAFRLLNTESSSEEVLISAIAKVGLEWNKNNDINFSFLRNQSGKNTMSIASGRIFDEGDIVYTNRQISYLERSMSNYIFNGNHTISYKLPLKIDWTYAITNSSQEQPDFRIFNDNINEDGGFEFRPAVYSSPVRFYRNMTEDTEDIKVNLGYDFNLKKEKELGLKAGYSRVVKTRDFTENRLNYAVQAGQQYDGNVENLFTDENTGLLDDGSIGLYVLNAGQLRNNYTGQNTITAGYGMMNWDVTNKLKTVVGARVENTNIIVASKDPNLSATKLAQLNILPSVNFSYDLMQGRKHYYNIDSAGFTDSSEYHSRDLKLRMSYNQTVARPNFRELSPFDSDDFVFGAQIVGNENLKITEIKNYDIRLEYYPKSGEQLSVAAFYKDFTNPIEQITSAKANNTEFNWVNNTKGTVYGLELELRKNLDFISQKLTNFDVSGNLTLVKSEAQVNEQELELIKGSDPEHANTRPFFGQSPYIVNTALSYANDSIGVKANVTMNVFGERLVLVTKGGLPDVYELPRPSLDFNISKTIGERFNITVRAKNILNPDYKQVYKLKTKSDSYLLSTDNEDFIFKNYKKGRDFSFSISYKF